MKSLPPVSIFIITRLNSRDHFDVLRHTCEVALAQDYPDFEVVVSDNGGKFSALDALSSFENDQLKVFRFEENIGFSGNMNRCLQLCSYDIIKPLCDDDLIHPEFLTHTVPYVDDHTFVLTDMRKFALGCDPDSLTKSIDFPIEIDRRDVGYGRDMWTLGYHVSPSAVLYTRDLYDGIGGMDSKAELLADWDFFIEVCMYKEVVRLRQELCFAGVWSGSVTEKMIERPYFYPFEGLYTRFRFFHCKNLPARERWGVLTMLFREWAFQSLRPLRIRNWSRPQYRKGYVLYTKRFIELLFSKENSFSPRPN